jgi:hypothetical protein
MKEANSLMVFPLGGLDESRAYRSQPALPGGVFTTADALNVRGHEWATDRARGGSRPGLSKYFPQRVHDAAILPPYSIQDINQMYLAYIPPLGVYSYFTYGRASGTGTGIATRLGASHAVYNDTDPFTFACSTWDQAEGVAYIAEIDADETPNTRVFRADPDNATEDWDEFMPETADRITGMVVIGEYLYVGWYNALGSPAHRIYKYNKGDGTIVGDPNPWVTSSDYAGLVFSTASVNVLSAVGPLLGVQTASSTGRFSIWNTDRPTVLTPYATSASQGTYSTARSCKADSDGVEFFYTAAPVTGGNVQKIKSDATVIWSYTPTSDDVVLSYDRPGNRVYVLDRDNGTLRSVNCDTGVLKDTVSATPVGASTAWRDLVTDWNGNLLLFKNSAASADILAIDADHNAIWGPTTFENAVHDGISALRGLLVATRTRALVVSGGRVSKFDRDGPTPVTTFPNSLDPNAPVVFSRQNGPYLYYVDGGGYKRYNPQTDAMENWTASAGSMPVDDAGRSARLIETWRGRTVLSGFLADPQNVFMSRVDDPTDFDYAPTFTEPTQAVALNASYAGLVGDKVTCLIRWSDDVLVIGCDHSIWQLTGDPMAGGQLDCVSDTIGMAFGRPYCFDPDKTIYFFSTRGGVYTLRPGGRPVPVSLAVQGRMREVDVGEENTSIRMAWDDAAKGCHLFVTPLNYRTPADHWFYDVRWNAWWPVRFAGLKQNPKCCHAFDGDAADDRIILIGSWDSHVRAVDTLTGKDDGLPFESYVALGPVVAPDGGEVMMSELQLDMAENSDEVGYEVVAAANPQAALEGVPVREGVATAGRNPTKGVRVSAFAAYIYIRGTARWAIEAARVRLGHLGWVRGRGF